MGLGAAAGGLLAAGGQIGAAFIANRGGMNAGDFILPNYDPRTDPLFGAVRRDALTTLGFGDVRDVPSFYEDLAGRIRASDMDTKSKRRALYELGQYIDSGFDESALSYNGRFLRGGLNRIGLTTEDLVSRYQSDQALRQRRDDLASAEGYGLQEETVLARLRAAQEAARQMEAAAGFAAGGTPQNQLQRTLLARDDRELENLRDRLLVQANFGNLNQGEVFDTIRDAEMDQDLRLFRQAAEVSNALQGSLGTGSGQAQNANQGSQNALLNATQILSSQANARNQLRNQTSLDNALSTANAVSSGALILGDSIAGGDYDLLRRFQPDPNPAVTANR